MSHHTDTIYGDVFVSNTSRALILVPLHRLIATSYHHNMYVRVRSALMIAIDCGTRSIIILIVSIDETYYAACKAEYQLSHLGQIISLFQDLDLLGQIDP